MERRDDIGLDPESARLLLKNVKGYAIYLLDPGGHIVSWNPGAEAIKGYSADEIIGKHFSIFYTAEEQDAGEPDRELVAATSTVYETEGWRVRKNRQQFWASVTLTPLYDDGGRLTGFAKVTRDMTEYRRAQEARIRLERAEEALKLRDQFLGEAKRSLNLILATIRIHVEALKNTVEPVRGETAAGVSAKLTTLEWGLDRLSNMIEDVLRMAAEAGDKLLRDLQRRDR